MAVEFPHILQREASNDWNIVGNTAVAGQTSGASTDVRSDGGGLWVASLNDIQLWDQDDAKLWRAVRQICNGGVTPIVVFRNVQDQPWPAGYDHDYGAIPHGDDALFSDGSGYSQPVIDVIADGAAALRATTMDFELVNCGDFGGGEAFSIEHASFGWRLYEIATVEIVDATHVSVTFNPPLREAVADGARIEFDRPRCLMKLVNAAAMNLNLTVLPNTRATVKFVEARYQ